MALPDVHFGFVDSEELDWRDPEFEDHTADDDEELYPTPPDVVAVLGFDPLDEEVGKARDGVMVAWFPPADMANELSVDGGEEPDEIHLTLAYFGKDLTDGQVQVLKDTLAEYCSQFASLQGEVGGTGRFPATESSDGKDVLIRLVDVGHLEQLREGLLQELQAQGIEAYRNHGYTPHMTMAYVDPGDEEMTVEPLTVPIVIDKLTLAVGGERTEYPLNGEMVLKFNSCHSPATGEFCSTARGGIGRIYAGYDPKPSTRESSLWVVHPANGVIFSPHRQQGPSLIHEDWFDKIGLPSAGKAFDKLQRGTVWFDKDAKTIHVITYAKGHVPTDVIYQSRHALPPKVRDSYRVSVKVLKRDESVDKMNPTASLVHVPVPLTDEKLKRKKNDLEDELGKANSCHEASSGRFCSTGGGSVPKGSGEHQAGHWAEFEGNDGKEVGIYSMGRGGNINTENVSPDIFTKDDGLVRVVYNVNDQRLYFPNTGLSNADHGNFAPIIAESAGVQGSWMDLTQVRGVIDLRNREMTFYDMKNEALTIADWAKISVPRAEKTLERHLNSAMSAKFYVNRRPVKIESQDIDEVLGFGKLYSPFQKRQADAPSYRLADSEATCANCIHGGDGYCDAFHFNTSNASVCSAHEPLTPRFEKYTPPREVQLNAAKAITEYKANLTAADRGAEDLMLLAGDVANGRPLDKDQLQTIFNYLTDHYEVGNQESWSSHGAEWQEWFGLGGRAGLSWSRRVLRQVEKYNSCHGPRGLFCSGGDRIRTAMGSQGEKFTSQDVVTSKELPGSVRLADGNRAWFGFYKGGKFYSPSEGSKAGIHEQLASAMGVKNTDTAYRRGYTRWSLDKEYATVSASSSNKRAMVEVLDHFQGVPGFALDRASAGKEIVVHLERGRGRFSERTFFDLPSAKRALSYDPVFKGTLSEDLALEFTMESNSIDLQGSIIYKSADKQQVYGWASIATSRGKEMTDLQGDVLSPEEMEKMALDFVLNSRKAGEMHKNVNGVGRLIESVVLTKEKADAMGLPLPKDKDGNPMEAWWVGFKVDSPEVWDKVKKGDYAAFSIHGKGIRSKIEP